MKKLASSVREIRIDAGLEVSLVEASAVEEEGGRGRPFDWVRMMMSPARPETKYHFSPPASMALVPVAGSRDDRRRAQGRADQAAIVVCPGRIVHRVHRARDGTVFDTVVFIEVEAQAIPRARRDFP
jgi:hypothetical protein